MQPDRETEKERVETARYLGLGDWKKVGVCPGRNVEGRGQGGKRSTSWNGVHLEGKEILGGKDGAQGKGRAGHLDESIAGLGMPEGSLEG